MSFAAGLAVLDTHLVAAAAAIDAQWKDVAQGERVNLRRRIDYWVAEIGDPTKTAGAHETLGEWMFAVTVNVRVYIPVSDRSESLAANIEADLYAISVDIITRLMADFTLGGNATATEIAGAEFGWLNLPGWQRISTIPVVLDFLETGIPITE